MKKKEIYFNKGIPELKKFFIDAKLNEESLFQEKRYLELLVVKAVSSCDYKRIEFLIKKILFNIEIESFENVLLIYYTVSIITLLTRVVIIEGVCEKEAYALSDAYLSLNFKELKVKPLELIFEIFTNYMILIENTRFYKYNSTIVNEVIKYIHNNISSNLSTYSIAKQFRVTPEYLSCHFKTVTNIRLKSFINEEKIDFAKFLLRSSNMSLLEITVSLGYTDQSYFTKVFKKYTNTSPAQYRKIKKTNYIISKADTDF